MSHSKLPFKIVIISKIFVDNLVEVVENISQIIKKMGTMLIVASATIVLESLFPLNECLESILHVATTPYVQVLVLSPHQNFLLCNA